MNNHSPNFTNKQLKDNRYVWPYKKSCSGRRNLAERLVNRAVFQWEHNHAPK